MAFAPNSRYTDVPDREIIMDGRMIVYKGIRRIGESETLATHVVVAGDRYDLIAGEHFRDPEQFWRVADANYTFDPSELVKMPGERVIVPRER